MLIPMIVHSSHFHLSTPLHTAHGLKAYPGAATAPALDLLKQILKQLPDANYNVLVYIIRHLAKVAQHSGLSISCI